MNKLVKYSLLIAALLLSLNVYSQLRLPRLVSDGMVLQRDTDLKIWGWATPGDEVSIEFKGKSWKTTAGEEGRWEVNLPPMEAGGPYEMDVQADKQLTVKNILIGDVWLASGQSNMELTMERASPIYQEVIAQAENPDIRYFDVPDRYDFNQPQEDLEGGSWKAATPENVLNFSAVAYFFAKELYEKYEVPVGIINASLGGSPVEAWISEEALKEFPVPYAEAQRFKDSTLIREIQEKDKARGNAWYGTLRKKDQGYRNPEAPWYKPGLDDSRWAAMEIPGYWADTELGPVNGVVWFRKEIDVPASLAGKPAGLLLGRIVDSDSVYLNGEFVGTTGYQYPPRRYEIPAGLLKEGKNTLVIRVINESGRGGFVEDKPYQIAAGGDTIDLKGAWKYRLGAAMGPLPGQTFIRWKPLGLYNGMIAPLLKYPIKGVIWYQGESNTNDAAEYDGMFSALISNWRQKWGQGDFPFLYVQLANFMEAAEQPSESNWAELRDAQLKTLSVPNTAMAVTIDIGEWNDIHPLNKEDVGKRLALAAQKVAYGDESVVFSGPVFKSMEVKGNKAVLSFKNVGGGLTTNGEEELKAFAIAGADGNWFWAKAKIKGNKVVVWSDKVAKPVAVRYAWADNPEGANLYNKEGLPASPFQATYTDHQ
ncbi:sialate O-acetylesterase [Nafulsella turpanensis]|uniref:sialate O-acetylesterase n=1 Tax=Nafulsella turpanensis TaxID=1265690 RepID=UPI00034CDD5B|nr:sialate O-acetylesterase [Nafulsella turpanensis]